LDQVVDGDSSGSDDSFPNPEKNELFIYATRRKRLKGRKEEVAKTIEDTISDRIEDGFDAITWLVLRLRASEFYEVRACGDEISETSSGLRDCLEEAKTVRMDCQERKIREAEERAAESKRMAAERQLTIPGVEAAGKEEIEQPAAGVVDAEFTEVQALPAHTEEVLPDLVAFEDPFPGVEFPGIDDPVIEEIEEIAPIPDLESSDSDSEMVAFGPNDPPIPTVDPSWGVFAVPGPDGILSDPIAFSNDFKAMVVQANERAGVTGEPLLVDRISRIGKTPWEPVEIVPPKGRAPAKRRSARKGSAQ
jgi:hypothetical protein